MNVARYSETDFAERLRDIAKASSLFDPTIEKRTRAILQAVYRRGDDALFEFTEKLDGAKLRAEQLTVTRPELLEASQKADQGLRAAVELTAKNVEQFSRKSLRKAWSARDSQARKLEKSLILFSVSAFTFLAGPLRSSPRR